LTVAVVHPASNHAPATASAATQESAVMSVGSNGSKAPGTGASASFVAGAATAAAAAAAGTGIGSTFMDGLSRLLRLPTSRRNTASTTHTVGSTRSRTESSSDASESSSIRQRIKGARPWRKAAAAGDAPKAGAASLRGATSAPPMQQQDVVPQQSGAEVQTAPLPAHTAFSAPSQVAEAAAQQALGALHQHSGAGQSAALPQAALPAASQAAAGASGQQSLTAAPEGTASGARPATATTASTGPAFPEQPPPTPQPQPQQQQQWAAINFARDVVLQGKLGSGAFGTVYAALWLRPPASALHSFGPVLEVALPAQAPGRGRSLAHGGVKTVPGVRVAVKVVPLMGDGGMTYSARSLDLLKQEIQVRDSIDRTRTNIYGPPRVSHTELRTALKISCPGESSNGSAVPRNSSQNFTYPALTPEAPEPSPAPPHPLLI
jgi:hypothetical protein